MGKWEEGSQNVSSLSPLLEVAVVSPLCFQSHWTESPTAQSLDSGDHLLPLFADGSLLI